MKKIGASIYAVLCYLTGFAAILGWIAFTGNLIPAFSIDGPSEMALLPALAKNLALVVLFGLHHSITARQSFKSWLTQYIPAHLERSTFVLVSGLLLFFMMWEWEPMGGTIWNITTGTVGYYLIYGLFFSGRAILFISSFLIKARLLAIIDEILLLNDELIYPDDGEPRTDEDRWPISSLLAHSCLPTG